MDDIPEVTHIVETAKKESLSNDDVKSGVDTEEKSDDIVDNTCQDGSVDIQNGCDDSIGINDCSDSRTDTEKPEDDGFLSTDSEDCTISNSDDDSIPGIPNLAEDNVKNNYDANVPIICVHSTVGEQHYPSDNDKNNEKANKNHSEPSGEGQTDLAGDNSETQTRKQAEENNPDAETDSAKNVLSDSKKTSLEGQPTDISNETEASLEQDEQGAKGSSSAHPNSKFSFFRSIQNIIIATKWSKLRHTGSSKPAKNQNRGQTLTVDSPGGKSDRQRKISQKSLPGDFRKKSRDEHQHSDFQSDEDYKNQFKSQEFNRDGLEHQDSPSASQSKDKSHSKGHFSFFKRHHNSESPPPSSPPPLPPDLTEDQKALLKKSWDEIRDNIGQVGVIAFIGLFETHPDVKDTFVQFRGMSLESIFSSISLKEHALRVMTTVEKFINRIDRLDKLQKILEDLGRRHVTYRFNSEYINAVGMQFVFAMRPHVSQWTPEIEQAWCALVDIMTYHMERGTHLDPDQIDEEQSSA